MTSVDGLMTMKSMATKSNDEALDDELSQVGRSYRFTAAITYKVLIVNFRQSSHEFTFNVGIDLISKLTILTLMIYQVRTRMWFLEFIIYAGIKHLNEDFRVKFIDRS
jgi:hypothetical protein